jgi:hypothetical protein
MSDKKPKQEVGGVSMDHLRPPNPHPPGTVLQPTPPKKKRRRAGSQHDAGWSDWPKKD